MNSEKYFFDDGLKFECQQCGACCTGDPGTIYVTPNEIKEIAIFKKMPIKKLIRDFLYPSKESYSIREHKDDGRCYFFERGRGCLIYPKRPAQCKTFPFWLSHLRNEASWQYVAGECPGIGRGRHYSKEEILQKIPERG